jgi:hypothetical protein
MLNFSAVVLAAVAVIAVVVHLYYVHCVFQRTLVVVVNAAIVVHAKFACR